MRPALPLVQISLDGRHPDHQPAADLPGLQVAGLNEPAHGANGHPAELPGGLVEGPEQGLTHDLSPNTAVRDPVSRVPPTLQASQRIQNRPHTGDFMIGLSLRHTLGRDPPGIDADAERNLALYRRELLLDADLEKPVSQGTYYVEDIRRFREGPFKTEQNITNTASQDGKGCEIGLEQEPGASGKTEAAYLTRRLDGYRVRTYPATRDKLTRALPVSSQAEAGNVKVVRGAWNEAFFNELENFDGSGTGKDDQVDSFSGAHNHLSNRIPGASVASAGRRRFR